MKNKKGSPEYELVLAEAQVPTTTGSRLAQLFTLHQEDRPILLAVMRNPNTPAEILSGNMTKYIDAFCDNPAAPLLLLEMPGLLEGRHDLAIKRLLRRSTLPSPLAQYLTGHKNKNIAETARFHVGAAGEIDIKSAGWEAELVEIIARKMPKKSETLLRLHAFGIVPKWLAEATKLPKSEQLAHLKEPFIPAKIHDVWESWQANKNIPPNPDYPLTGEELKIIDTANREKCGTLIAWINKKARPTLIRASMDKLFTEEIYLQEYEISPYDMRRHDTRRLSTLFIVLASNINTPIDILRKLYLHNNLMLNNPNIPIEFLNYFFDNRISNEKNHWWIDIFIFHPELSLDRFKHFAEKYNYPELLLTRSDIPEEDRKQAFLELEANGTSVPTRFIALLSLPADTINAPCFARSKPTPQHFSATQPYVRATVRTSGLTD
jgi:hypothetical protein